MLPTSDRGALYTTDAYDHRATDGPLARVCPCRHPYSLSAHALPAIHALFSRPVTNPRVEDPVQNVYH